MLEIYRYVIFRIIHNFHLLIDIVRYQLRGFNQPWGTFYVRFGCVFPAATGCCIGWSDVRQGMQGAWAHISREVGHSAGLGVELAREQEWSFRLQNVQEILNRHFMTVKRDDYEDALAITKTQDMMDWIWSTISIAGFTEKDMDGLFDYFEAIMQRDGAINIPKECGLFISTK